MAVKKWLITGRILHDAQREYSVRVEANGHGKAEERGLMLLKKKYKTPSISVISVEQLDDDGNVIKERKDN